MTAVAFVHEMRRPLLDRLFSHFPRRTELQQRLSRLKGESPGLYAPDLLERALNIPLKPREMINEFII